MFEAATVAVTTKSVEDGRPQESFFIGLCSLEGHCMTVVCPVCRMDDVATEEQAGRDLFELECRACGHFQLDGTAKAVALANPPAQPWAAALRSHALRRLQVGGRVPTLRGMQYE